MDINTNAFRIVQRLTAENNDDQVVIGRAGGLKGGRARARALAPERRLEIAKKAINARWKKSQSKQKNTVT